MKNYAYWGFSKKGYSYYKILLIELYVQQYIRNEVLH